MVQRSLGRSEGTATGGCPNEFSYVVPLSADDPFVTSEWTQYLEWISGQGELIVVDGSPREAFAVNDRVWGGYGIHVAPSEWSLVGKVANVMTGIRLASHERVVVADDDVRFGFEIHALVARLDGADVVRPQNYFDPLPWHALWDSGRSLLNRVAGGDWPGTLALRRSTLLAAGGYAGDVMFENYELVKTVEAAGGCHRVARDIFVCRLPPSASHFLSQRVRQAYDEIGRPGRLVPFLAVVPVVGVLAGMRRWRTLRRATFVSIALVVTTAEIGRQREGAWSYFPFRCSIASPLWVAERSVCSWAALYARARGGVVYRGRRVKRATLSSRERRMRIAARAVRRAAREH